MAILAIGDICIPLGWVFKECLELASFNDQPDTEFLLDSMHSMDYLSSVCGFLKIIYVTLLNACGSVDELSPKPSKFLK